MHACMRWVGIVDGQKTDGQARISYMHGRRDKAREANRNTGSQDEAYPGQGAKMRNVEGMKEKKGEEAKKGAGSIRGRSWYILRPSNKRTHNVKKEKGKGKKKKKQQADKTEKIESRARITTPSGLVLTASPFSSNARCRRGTQQGMQAAGIEGGGIRYEGQTGEGRGSKGRQAGYHRHSSNGVERKSNTRIGEMDARRRLLSECLGKRQQKTSDRTYKTRVEFGGISPGKPLKKKTPQESAN